MVKENCKTVFDNHKEVGGLYFHVNTPQEVCAEILRAFAADYRVRLFYGDRDSGVCWSDMYNVMGTVRCSTGPMRIPILVHNSTSSGGPAILTSSVVRMVRTSDKKVLYTHKAFEYVNHYEVKGASVYHNGTLILNAPTPERAEKFKEFMLGHRFAW